MRPSRDQIRDAIFSKSRVSLSIWAAAALLLVLVIVFWSHVKVPVFWALASMAMVTGAAVALIPANKVLKNEKELFGFPLSLATIASLAVAMLFLSLASQFADLARGRSSASMRDLSAAFPDLADIDWQFESPRVTLSCYFDVNGRNLVAKLDGDPQIYALNGKAMRFHTNVRTVMNRSPGFEWHQRDSQPFIELAGMTCDSSGRMHSWLSLAYDEQTNEIKYAWQANGFRTEREKIQEKVAQQFSPWSGEHRPLARLIQSEMNDPSSYEHIDTNHRIENDHVFVQMRFRSSNAFGAKMKHVVQAKCSFDGEILEIVNLR